MEQDRQKRRRKGMSEKEKRNMQQTCLEVYWRGVYRPGEVGVQRESVKMVCPAFKSCLVHVHGGIMWLCRT